MTLLIVAHPHFDLSNANKTIVQTLQHSEPDLEVRHLDDLYPNHKINAATEQAALLRHELIVLQFPLYWYNMPSMPKAWFDQVFLYGFAYGTTGDKLKHRRLLVSITIGQPEQNYQKNEASLMSERLRPIQMSTEYAHMHYFDPICLYNISTVLGHTSEDIV